MVKSPRYKRFFSQLWDRLAVMIVLTVVGGILVGMVSTMGLLWAVVAWLISGVVYAAIGRVAHLVERWLR